MFYNNYSSYNVAPQTYSNSYNTQRQSQSYRSNHNRGYSNNNFNMPTFNFNFIINLFQGLFQGGWGGYNTNSYSNNYPQYGNQQPAINYNSYGNYGGGYDSCNSCQTGYNTPSYDYNTPTYYQGPAGPMGPQGPKGDRGCNGLDGRDGYDGKDGYNGVDGKDGIDGKDGKDGYNGVDGKDGIDGKDGKDGIDGKDGKDGIDGKDGKDGIDGKDGKDGIDGKDGKDGIDGKDGKDGSGDCCTKTVAGLVGDPYAQTYAVVTQDGTSLHIPNVLQQFNSNLKDGDVTNLLTDTSANGDQYSLTNTVKTISQTNGVDNVATDTSVIKIGDYTITTASGASVTSTITGPNGFSQTINDTDAPGTTITLPGINAKVEVSDTIPGANGATDTGIIVTSAEEGIEYGIRYVGREGNGVNYIDTIVDEQSCNAGKGATGDKFKITAENGQDLWVGFAQLMNLDNSNLVYFETLSSN